MPTIASPDLLPRDVYRAPCLTEGGHMVLFAVDRNHRLIPDGELLLHPEDDDRIKATNELWRRLDLADPEHSRRRRSY